MCGAREPLELPLLGRVSDVTAKNRAQPLADGPQSPNAAQPCVSPWKKREGESERENERERNNKTGLSSAEPERGLLSCLLGRRENSGVILEITLLKINVGLEECVIVP